MAAPREWPVTTDNHSVGGVLFLQGLDGVGHVGDHALLGLVEALVYLAFRAAGIVSQNSIQVVNPVFDRGRAAEDDVDSGLRRHIADITLDIVIFVVNYIACYET